MQNYQQNNLINTKEKKFCLNNYLSEDIEEYYKSKNGVLFHADCMSILPKIKSNSIDTIFADPPFNLGKIYGKNTNDNIAEYEYIAWCKNWILECVRIIKPGGSIFLYNLPKWNILLGAYLSELNMMFRHWIAIDINTSMPITGRLYPSHYSLIYYSKGKPNTFKRIRIPVATCRHCGGEIKDYGGHRKYLNTKGISLKDIWYDIPPIRHWKFKDKKRAANALSTKLVSRAILMSTNIGDIVLDPFGGSGTTFDCCEYYNRQWIGIEIDYVEEIVTRLSGKKIQHHATYDYVEEN